MKKIGIITIIDYNNCGNRLQNYAVQEVLKSLGCECETIKNQLLKMDLYQRIRRMLKQPTNQLVAKLVLKTKVKLSCILVKIVDPEKAKEIVSEKQKIKMLMCKRIERYKDFTNQHIKESSFTINPVKILAEFADCYDVFITGSDQIWNPTFRGGAASDFLTFAPAEKRIAYAASFGIAELPNEYVERYKTWLTQMKYISVREEAGAKIVRTLTGRNADVLVDPTLMLTKEKWLAVAQPAVHKPQNVFLLTYFLGDITPETQSKIDTIAKENGLEIVNLLDVKDENRYLADPAEFLDYIYSSAIFLTDSFHGAVFSILFEKAFIIFNRAGNAPAMNSRIQTLLSKFDLYDRSAENIKTSFDAFNTDYSHVPAILDGEREKAYKYLKKALDI